MPPHSLLSPLGQHRRAHIKRSKGKRAARRAAETGPQDRSPSGAKAPPRPELCAEVDVGFNSITRRLEELSQTNSDSQSIASKVGLSQPYSMIFVARGDLSSAFNCHFPKMIGVTSKDSHHADKARLVGFSKPCSDRLGSALGVARVSSVAVTRGAPGAGALWDFVQKAVAPVGISWLQDVGCTEYRETKISSVESSVGTKKAKMA